MVPEWGSRQRCHDLDGDSLTQAELVPQQLISKEELAGASHQRRLCVAAQRNLPSARFAISRTSLVACRGRGWPARPTNT